jgi:hypothetical protein
VEPEVACERSESFAAASATCLCFYLLFTTRSFVVVFTASACLFYAHNKSIWGRFGSHLWQMMMMSMHEDSSLHLLLLYLSSRFVNFPLINDLMDETEVLLSCE